MQQLTGEAYVARYGHEWNSPDLAREYVERSDRTAQLRADGFRIMLGLLPFEQSAPFRVLDIGTGQGFVAGLVLDAFPEARAIGLDVSEPMMQIARKRMAVYGDRFSYCLGDFVDGDLPGDVGAPFDVAVSSRAIHHLPPEKKQLLYRSIYRALNPGGCFFDLDSAAPPDDYLRERIRAAGRYLQGESAERGPERAGRIPLAGHYFITVGEHMRFLREAGFTSVDLFWKRLGMTLLGGYKRA